MTINGQDIAIKDVMREPTIVESGMAFRDVIKKMIIEKTNSLVVVDADGVAIGMVNPKSLIKHVVPDYLENDSIAAHFATESIFREEAAKVADVAIEDFMQKDISTVKADDTLMQAAVVALESGQVRIPVVDENNKPIGLLTRTELKNVIGAFLDIEESFSK